jgi:hypothetical protein
MSRRTAGFRLIYADWRMPDCGASDDAGNPLNLVELAGSARLEA